MTYCERCGGEIGTGCLGTGTADCDLNMELKRDGVSPDHYRNRVPAPYVVDPLNPTDEELAAAIQRGLGNGSLIDAADWMAQHAAELDRA